MVSRNNVKEQLVMDSERLPQSEFIRNALANRVHAVMQVKSIK